MRKKWAGGQPMKRTALPKLHLKERACEIFASQGGNWQTWLILMSTKARVQKLELGSSGSSLLTNLRPKYHFIVQYLCR